MLNVHVDRDLTIGVRELDASSGMFVYRAKYFGVSSQYIKSKVDNGCVVHVDYNSTRLAIKRKNTHIEKPTTVTHKVENIIDIPTSSTKSCQSNQERDQDDDSIKEILSMIPQIIKTMRDIKMSYTGELTSNIVFRIQIQIQNVYSL